MWVSQEAGKSVEKNEFMTFLNERYVTHFSMTLNGINWTMLSHHQLCHQKVVTTSSIYGNWVSNCHSLPYTTHQNGHVQSDLIFYIWFQTESEQPKCSMHPKKVLLQEGKSLGKMSHTTVCIAHSHHKHKSMRTFSKFGCITNLFNCYELITLIKQH